MRQWFSLHPIHRRSSRSYSECSLLIRVRLHKHESEKQSSDVMLSFTQGAASITMQPHRMWLVTSWPRSPIQNAVWAKQGYINQAAWALTWVGPNKNLFPFPRSFQMQSIHDSLVIQNSLEEKNPQSLMHHLETFLCVNCDLSTSFKLNAFLYNLTVKNEGENGNTVYLVLLWLLIFQS